VIELSNWVDIVGLLGLFLLAITLIWVGRYNIRIKQARRGWLFTLSGVALLLITVKALLSGI